MKQPEILQIRSMELRSGAWPRLRRLGLPLCLAALWMVAGACGSDSASGTNGAPSGSSGHRRGGAGGGHGGGHGGAPAGPPPERGVPVEISPVTRSSISLFFETQGTLEAEQEVDLLARVAGPVVKLDAEEGQRIRKGQLLARIDDRELRAQLDVTNVRLKETELTYERSKKLSEGGLVSQETVDQALASYQSAQSDFERLQIQVLYTEVRAPFSGLVVNRYVKFAQTLSVGSPVFRISDFDPLLCPIQVPERELPRLRIGQPARIEVEAWPDDRFEARVLRVSPVVDAATGTFKVTLEVKGDRLRPGMFASVYLEMESRSDTLVIPKAALALDSLDDSVFVVEDGVAQRRRLQLGFQNSQLLEILDGVSEGENIVVVGQDDLSEGTPVDILRGETAVERPVPGPPSPRTGAGPAPGTDRRRGDGGSGRPGGFGGRNIDLDDPSQVEKIRQRMKKRGFSDEEIDRRLERMKDRSR